MEHKRGIWFGVAAYLFWGLTPLFWNLVSTDAASLLLHRIVWSVPILALIITLCSQWSILKDRYASWASRLSTIAAAGLLAVNWGTFVWAVTNDHIVEASLGYFINPLVSVALGVIILKEPMGRCRHCGKRRHSNGRAAGCSTVDLTDTRLLFWALWPPEETRRHTAASDLAHG